MQLTKKLSSKRNLLQGGSKTKNTKNTRKSPTESATSMIEGTIRRGNDGQLWVIKKSSNGIPRWMPYISVELNGFKALTIDYLANNIGKEIEIYEREEEDIWPKQTDNNLEKIYWVSNGHAKYTGKKIKNNFFENWLYTQTPTINNTNPFVLLGQGKYNGIKINELQLDNKTKKLVSSTTYFMQAFIKINN
jgi:hypothetical protein